MKRILTITAVMGIVLAGLVPANAQRDVAGLLLGAPERYKPHTIGQPVDLHFVFGPYVIPPGSDSNRITLDLPLETGYIVAVAPDLVDANTGEIPTQQVAHIHHAHWFRATNDPQYDYYPGASFGTNGLSWVFGTGEEKSQGRLDDRARLEAVNNDGDTTNNFTYGIPVDGKTPNVLIYMIHNKLATVGNYLVVLDVTFIPGTRDEIRAATGRDIHPLYSQLWGQTKDETIASKKISARWTVSNDATGIAMGGHVHPGGKAVIISNLGSKIDTNADGTLDTPACLVGTAAQRDPDGDGFDGVAILNSYKYDHDMNVWPYSEDYQMGVTKFGWRAPLHKGDILEQSATYAIDNAPRDNPFKWGSPDGLTHHWYQAMSYTGIYMDREQVPTTPAGTCSVAALGPNLVGGELATNLGKPVDSFDVQGRSTIWAAGDPRVTPIASMFTWFGTGPLQGMVNHYWAVTEKVCAQPGLEATAGYVACGPSAAEFAYRVSDVVVDQIHVSGFFFVPGDLNVALPDPDNAAVRSPVIPQVKAGSTVSFVNEDASLNVRHTFTTCAWPCVGDYKSNFPLSDGGQNAFDTGKLGNVDPIDGGADVAALAEGRQTDTVPVFQMEINLDPGVYSYFCRIHPYMRGGFKVIA